MIWLVHACISRSSKYDDPTPPKKTLFGIQTFNLALAARMTHKWYHSHFPRYPKKRNALIPYVYWIKSLTKVLASQDYRGSVTSHNRLDLKLAFLVFSCGIFNKAVLLIRDEHESAIQCNAITQSYTHDIPHRCLKRIPRKLTVCQEQGQPFVLGQNFLPSCPTELSSHIIRRLKGRNDVFVSDALVPQNVRRSRLSTWWICSKSGVLMRDLKKNLGAVRLIVKQAQHYFVETIGNPYPFRAATVPHYLVHFQSFRAHFSVIT